MAQTQQQRRAETRARLVAAATALFAERGVDAVSVDAVAEAAGRTSGAVYDHFGSKQGLLLAVLDDWRDAVVGAILGEFAVADRMEDRLRSVARNVVVTPSPHVRRGLQLERQLEDQARRDPAVAAVLRGRRADAQRWLTRGLAAWAADGRLGPGTDPAVVALTLRAVVAGLVAQHQLDPASLDESSAAAALGAVLGLAPATPAHPPTP